MPLPLPVRKNIRDSEPKLKEHLEKINNATGKEWTFETDWESNVNLLDESYRKDIGSLYQDQCMGYVASAIEKSCENPLTKEAFVEATPNNKIIIRVNAKAANYWVYKIENGDLVLEHKPSICNTHEIGYQDLAKIIPTQAGALSVTVRKNIEANREKQQELLEEIAKITGSGEWVLEVDWNAIVPKMEQYYQESIGDLYIDTVLGGVKQMLEDKLKNETVKEAFNEATSNRTITINLNDKMDCYWKVSIKDGGLLVEHKKSICNTHEVGYTNLAKIIPSPGIITLVSRLSLQNSQEKLDETLERIKNAVGEEYTFDESCLEPFYKAMNEYHRNDVGDLLYGQIMPYVAQNIEQRVKDDMVKEAFIEATPSKQIIVRMNPKQQNYWEWKFENGTVVISCKDIVNVHDIGNFDFEKLL